MTRFYVIGFFGQGSALPLFLPLLITAILFHVKTAFLILFPECYEMLCKLLHTSGMLKQEKKEK
jgi:hypothetical protein